MNVVQHYGKGFCPSLHSFNAARSIVCGATSTRRTELSSLLCFNAARSIVCGATSLFSGAVNPWDVSMPHAALYVVQQVRGERSCRRSYVSMPHAALYVVQLRRSQLLSRAGREGILESRRFFVPFFPYRAAFSPKNHGVDRRVPLCGPELRPNGKWRR